MRRALRERALALELACLPRAKRALLRTLLARHRDDRPLVFTAFAENAYIAAEDNLIPVITGETSAKERAESPDKHALVYELITTGTSELAADPRVVLFRKRIDVHALLEACERALAR